VLLLLSLHVCCLLDADRFGTRGSASGVDHRLKVLVGFYQIAVKSADVYSIALPSAVQIFLGAVDVLISFNVDVIANDLTCVGIGGYVSRLQLLMALPIAACFLVIFCISFARCLCTPRDPLAVGVLEASAPWILRISFLA